MMDNLGLTLHESRLRESMTLIGIENFSSVDR